MTPDLAGRLQTRLAVFLFAVLPVLALLAVLFDLGGASGATALFALYWLPVGLLGEIVYVLAQRLRREGDWPPLHTVYGLALEGAAVFAAMRADALPGLPDCLRTTQDLALRRAVCVEPSLSDGETVAVIVAAILVTLVVLGVVLPILSPRWTLEGWRLWPRRVRP